MAENGEKQVVHRLSKPLVILALVLLMLSSILGITILFLPESDYFNYYIQQTDKYLSVERYQDAAKALEQAVRYADTRLQWFRLFKRAYQVSSAMEDYQLFNAVLTKSRRFIKAGGEHDALYVASLLWTSQYEKAAANLYGIQQQPGFETLVAETLLSHEVYRNYTLDGISPLEFIKGKISFHEDPDFFRIIGTIAENDILLFNAALLYMELGNQQDVSSLLGRFSSDRIPPFKKGILYYDLGNFQKALEMYLAQDLLDEDKENQRFSLKEQIGDIYHITGDKEKAVFYYESAVDLHPKGSWKLYSNLARLYLDAGYSRKSRVILENGMDLFPHCIELLKDYVSFFHDDYSAAVKKRLETYIRENSINAEAELMYIEYFPDSLNPVQYQAKLWGLFNQNTGNASVARYLLWYLTGLGDRQSIQLVLDRYESGPEKPHWYIFYQALLKFMNHETEDALALIDQASVVHPSWVYEINKGLMYYNLAEFDKAEKLLHAGTEELKQMTSITNRGVLLSRIYTDLGDMYLNEKKFEKALEVLRQAIESDPSNFRAKTMYEKVK